MNVSGGSNVMNNTTTTTFWLDSRNAEGRRDSSGNIVTSETNNLRFPFRHTEHNVIGLAISDVGVDMRMPRLKPSERLLQVIIRTGGTTFLEELIVPIFGPTPSPGYNTYPSLNTLSGCSGNLVDFINWNNEHADVTGNSLWKLGLSLIDSNSGQRIAAYLKSSSPDTEIAIVDNPLAHILGFHEFPNSGVPDNPGGTPSYRWTTFTDITNPDNKTTDLIGTSPHNYEVPDLYLHALNVDVHGEQKRRHANIVYKTMWNSADVFDLTSFAAPKYIDKERVVTPIEVNNKYLNLNDVRFVWCYEDGSIIDLNANEWSLKLELIKATGHHYSS